MKKWFNERFIPQASKLGNQRHLSSIRDAFAIFTPIIIVGALAVLWRSVIFNTGGGQSSLSGLWTTFNDHSISKGGHYSEYLTVMNHWMLYVQVGTINVLSIYVSFGIGYFLAKSRKNNTPVIAGLVSLASFMAVTNMMVTADTWEGGMYWLGARGLISAIVLGLLMTELFCFLSAGDKLAIKMPAGVPPAVSRAFAKLFPAIFTIITAALINLLVWLPFHFQGSTLSEGVGIQMVFHVPAGLNAEQVKALEGLKAMGGADSDIAPILGSMEHFKVTGPGGDALGNAFAVFSDHEYFRTSVPIAMHGGDVTLTNAIYAGVVQPFVSMAGTTSGAFGIAILYVLLISFFWFFGLHGTNIINGAFNPIWLILYANNIAGDHNVFVQGTFDAYVFIGGWGATLALLISTLIFGKKGSAERQVAKFAVGPGVFQINEPVTFGYPLVLNAFLVIPLFLVMPILVVTTYIGIQWFGIPVVKTLIPWTMPVGFGGLVASGSPWGFVLAIANLIIAVVVWTPFVLLMRNKDSSKAKKAASNTIEGKKAIAKKVKA